MGSAVQVPFLSDMEPSETPISQTVDITPQTLRDAVTTITPTSRADALQWSQALEIQAYTDYGSGRFKKLGKAQMETVEILARDVALQGSLVVRSAARAALDAGTAADRFSDADVSEMETMLMQLKAPAFVGNGRPQWFAIMPPDVFHDVRTSGNVLNVGIYQDKEIILRFELGQLGPFKLIVSPWAKTFGAAGADNALVAATTIAASATANRALDKTIEVALATNISVGRFLTIGTEETGDTHFPKNERVRWVSTSGTTITIVGEGANGGLRFDHPVGAPVRNADSVYPVAFGGPASLAKLYATEVGEFGEVVGPKKSGIADQFATLAYKFYGGYGRWSESYISRGEYSSSLDA
jgi:N4-gp56 family major capsid protein